MVRGNTGTISHGYIRAEGGRLFACEYLNMDDGQRFLMDKVECKDEDELKKALAKMMNVDEDTIFLYTVKSA